MKTYLDFFLKNLLKMSLRLLSIMANITTLICLAGVTALKKEKINLLSERTAEADPIDFLLPLLGEPRLISD